MPYVVVRFQETPNPNALKCIVDRRFPNAPRSFFNATQAAADPIASRLFSLPGVTNVLIHDDFITIGKSPDAGWKPLRDGLQRILREAQ